MVLVLRLLPPHCGVFNVEEVRFKGGKKNERRRWRFVKQDFCYFAETFLAVNRETRRSGAGEGGGGRLVSLSLLSLHSSLIAGMSEARHRLSKNNKPRLPNFLDN